MSHALSAEGLHDLAREFRLPMTIYTASDSLEPDQAIDPRMICIPVEDEERLQVSAPEEKNVRDYQGNVGYVEITLPHSFWTSTEEHHEHRNQ